MHGTINIKSTRNLNNNTDWDNPIILPLNLFT